MAVIKCKMCGGDLIIEPGSTIAECEFCGSRQTIPTQDNEKKLTLFSRANRLRMNSEFDKAFGIYESIVADFPEEAEAYWGLVLCKYGIEYVDDPATGRKIPTCHRSSYDSVMEDPDLEQALENANVMARRIYREEAKQIEEIRRGIIEVSGKEAPYDIFICYKETAPDGDRTLDSVLAQDVYDALTAKGYRVFFSRITLEDKLGQEYEPYIFAALNSAKIMLAFGTDYEYYNAVWVKNEWSRYLKLMTKDKTKHLIPCFKNIDAYDMPKEFTRLQAQDMGKVGAIQDLLRGIEKLLPHHSERKNPSSVVTQAPTSGTAPLLERVFMFLEDGEWNEADAYCERVLDLEPKNAMAYVGKLMVEIKVRKMEYLSRCAEPFDRNANYQKALRFSDSQLADYLQASINAINQRKEAAKKDETYNFCRKVIDGKAPDTIENLKEAIRGFQSIPGWRDADELCRLCREKVEAREETVLQQMENAYLLCIDNMKKADSAARYDFVAQKFVELGNYKDSKQLAEQCKAHSESLRRKTRENEEVFGNAIDVLNRAKKTEDLSQKYNLAKYALELFDSIPEYSSSRVFLQQAKALMEETSKRIESERIRYEEIARQENAKKERQSAWRNAGVCQYCGGQFKGLFSKKCVSCGKPKDY